MSWLNPLIQRLKLESAYAHVRGSSKPTLSIEMQHSRRRKEEEAESGWAKAVAGVGWLWGKATRCTLSAALDGE